MLQEPLNDRFATVEDIFVKFVAPKLELEYNDMFYLYTEQRNLCPNVEQIKNGFEIYYMPRYLHNSVYNGISRLDNILITRIKDYYAIPVTLQNTITSATTFKELNDSATANKNSDLKFSVIDCFRYMNENFIAKEPAFENYQNSILDEEFMVTRSSVASDNPKVVNLSFSKLRNDITLNWKSGSNLITNQAIANNKNAVVTTKQVTDPGKIDTAIWDVGSFTIKEMAEIYKTAVFGYNLDAVYKTYNFNGYTVLDNSCVHTPQSLVRLCDIAEIGRFNVYDAENTTNVAYMADEYIITSMTSATARATNTIQNPYKFEVESTYLPTGESLGWQLLSIQITDSGKDGVGQTTMVVDEATAMYQKYLIQNKIMLNPTQVMTSSVRWPDDSDDDGETVDGIASDDSTGTLVPGTGSRAGGDIDTDDNDQVSDDGGGGITGGETGGGITVTGWDTGAKLSASSATDIFDPVGAADADGFYELSMTIDPTMSDDRLSTRTDLQATEIKKPDGTTGVIYTSRAEIADFNNDAYQSNIHNTLITPEESLNATLSVNRVTQSELVGIDAVVESWSTAFQLGSVRQAGTITYSSGAIRDLNEFKYAFTDQLLYTIGAGIIPWVNGEIMPVYLPTNTTIDNTLYTNYTPAFTNKNRAIGKRSALFTMRQNESMHTTQIMITQYGPELIIKYTIGNTKSPDHPTEYMFDYIDQITSVGEDGKTAYKDIEFEDKVTESGIPYWEADGKADVFFQSKPGINTSSVEIASNFIVLDKKVRHYADENMPGELTIRIVYNAYAESLPDEFKYLVIRLYPVVKSKLKVNDQGKIIRDTSGSESLDGMDPIINGCYTYNGTTNWTNVQLMQSTFQTNEVKLDAVRSATTGDIEKFIYKVPQPVLNWQNLNSLSICNTLHAWGQNAVKLVTLLINNNDLLASLGQEFTRP